MILLVTDGKDVVVNHIEDQINKLNLNYERINVEYFPNEYFSFLMKNGKILFKYQPFVTGVFIRFFHNISGETLNLIPPNYRMFVEKELNDVLIAPLLSLGSDVRWVNKPEANFRASIKLAQLKTAADVGFDVPDTMVSSSSSKLIDFWKEKRGQVVTKAIHQGWVSNLNKEKDEVIFTNIVEEAHLYKLDPIKNYPPILFQEKIDKLCELRVVVLGDRCFSCSLGESLDVDWRKDKKAVVNSTRFNLPESVYKKCVDIVHCLGLSFGVLDLILDKKGKYFFLEKTHKVGGYGWKLILDIRSASI